MNLVIIDARRNTQVETRDIDRLPANGFSCVRRWLIVVSLLLCLSGSSGCRQEMQKIISVSGAVGGGELVLDFGEDIQMDFIWVPAGEFLMGCPVKDTQSATASGGALSGFAESVAQRDRTDHPLHLVRLSHGFWMSKHEVTEAQWMRIMGKTVAEQRSLVRNDTKSVLSSPDLPVCWINWYDCKEFIQRVNLAIEKGRCRLPTEAEWEYACRGTKRTPVDIASSFMQRRKSAWCAENSGEKRHPVGTLLPNSLGLYDMLGNVAEWCEDWHSDFFRSLGKNTNITIDPCGPEETSNLRWKVIRGGSFGNDLFGPCRPHVRNVAAPDERASHIGFRIVYVHER
jgi:formylglycine-generating enzyme required for sulfatase activity